MTIMRTTTEDLETLIRGGVRRTATALRVADSDWKSVTELLTEIHDRDPTIHGLLESFLSAYTLWFEHHARLEAGQASGDPPSKNIGALTAAIARRNEARKELLEALAREGAPPGAT